MKSLPWKTLVLYVGYFLGIKVSHTTDGIHLSQTKYITDLLGKAKI